MSVARRYATFTDRATVASTAKTAGTIISASTIRPKIYEFSIGTDLGSAAADNILTWTLQRFTVAGTAASSPTPSPLDPADPPALASAGANHSAEPTYTAGLILYEMGFNQRATYRWQAPPDGELVMPATAANGLGMQVGSPGYTGQADFMVMHAE